VIKDETADKLGLSGHLVLHVHQFNHVKINSTVSSDGADSINNDFAKRVAEDGWDLGVEGGASDFDKEVTGDFLFKSEGLKEFEALGLGNLVAINNNAGVDTFAEVSLSLAHELTNEEDVGSSSVTDDLILSGSSASNHSGSWVLDLHLVEEDSSVLSKFNLTGTTDEPKSKLLFVQESSTI
jgi:hypothetical protein